MVLPQRFCDPSININQDQIIKKWKIQTIQQGSSSTFISRCCQILNFKIIHQQLLLIQYMNKLLRTIDPLKGLKGKLNFLRTEYPSTYSLVRVVNSINGAEQQKSSLDKYSIEQINSLASSSNIDNYEHKKMLFEGQVHKNSNHNIPIGTIYEDLDKHSKRLVSSLLKYSYNLNSRQISYLHHSIRSKLNAIYPNWKNLHINPESPLRRELGLLPTVKSLQALNEIKLVEKKKVTTSIIGSRKQKQSQNS